jgi:3-oxoacyl-[acyl-carrier-protein] synthase-3
MNATIVGLGEWVPATVRKNEAWPADFGQPKMAGEDRVLADVSAKGSDDPCDRILARHLASEAGDPFLGTKLRRIADERMASWEAEAQAARAALQDAGIEAREVDVVMAYAAVPDHISPPSATRVAHAIGATRAYAPGVHTACASAIVQLELAAALVESGRARTVLLTQSFLMTRAFPLSHPASPNIGDAATAIVVRASQHRGVICTHAVTHGEFYDAVLWRRRGDDHARWFEAGGPMFLSTNDSASAHRLIQNTLRFGSQTILELMDKARVPLRELSVLASVQPRRWVPASIAEVLELDPACAPDTFHERAHLGACGVVVNLLEARRRGLLSEGALVALYGQGAGFTRAAGLIRWGA